MNRRTIRTIALISAVVVAASACGGSDETTEAQPPDTQSTATTDPANQDEEAASGGGEPETLEDYLGSTFFGIDPEEQAANLARQEQQVQEMIAECMAQEGFEYIPTVRPFNDAGFGAPGDVELAKDIGFGITTRYGETTPPGFEEHWTDPNEAIIGALSESERSAYNDTLYGSSVSSGGFGSDSDSATAAVDDGSDSGEVVDDGGFNGCSGEAYMEVYAYEELAEIYELLDLESLGERVEADPRVADIIVDWSECMDAQGYDYEDPESMYEDVYSDLQERFAEIVGSTGVFFDPLTGMSEEEIEEFLTNSSPEELDDFFTQEQQTTEQDIDQEALADLQAEERALAVANAECSGDLFERYTEIYREYEAALVDENRALLEQVRDRREG